MINMMLAVKHYMNPTSLARLVCALTLYFSWGCWSNGPVRAGRNIAKLSLNSAHGLRIYDLLRADQVVIERSALEHINSFFGPKADAVDTSDASLSEASASAEDAAN